MNPSPQEQWVALALLRLSTRQLRLLHQSATELRSLLTDEPLLRQVLREIGYDLSRYNSLQQRLGVAAKLCADLERTGWTTLYQDHPHYPIQFVCLADPPIVLFVRGDVSLLSTPQVALVGSRKASSLALQTAERFGDRLAQSGITITSGLALGIDAAAHGGALKRVGGTLAVMATGPDRVYPLSHQSLADQIVAQGGVLLTEKLPGTAPKPYLFPERNRLISALSLGVVVVEAKIKSGSLITARLALEQGKEVMAVPGTILNSGARGCHKLIKEGAQLVESPEDVLAQLYEPLTGQMNREETDSGAASDQPSSPDLHLTPQPDPLLKLLEPGPMAVDRLAAQSGYRIADLLVRLTELELGGQIVQNGQQIERIR